MVDTLQLPYFDGAVVEVFESFDTPAERAAIDAFLALGAKDRMGDSHHIHAYYRDFHQAVGGEDWLDDEMGIPATPQEIWPHVNPHIIATEINPDDGLAYVMLECSCAWEEEHGLLMVWREGKILNKVGGYDGHTTNTYAYDDASKANVVYSASSKEFTTYLSK